MSEKRAVGSTRADKDSLVDLMGDETATSPQLGSTNSQTTTDLLADIFGTGASTTSNSAASNAPRGGIEDIMGLFGNTGSGAASLAPASQRPTSTSPQPPTSSAIPVDLFSSPSSSPAPQAAASQPKTITAYTSPSSGLVLTFSPTKDATKPNVVNVTARFSTSSNTSGPISGINFQAAVPKTMKLQMLAISTSEINPGQEATQLMRIMLPPGAQLKLRLRLLYSYQGESKQEQTDFTFPQGAF